MRTVAGCYLLYVLHPQGNPHQLLPDAWGQVQIKGFLGPDGYTQQYAQKLVQVEQVLRGHGRVQQKPV